MRRPVPQDAALERSLKCHQQQILRRDSKQDFVSPPYCVDSPVQALHFFLSPFLSLSVSCTDQDRDYFSAGSP